MSARSDVQDLLDRYTFGAALALLNLRLVAKGGAKKGWYVQIDIIGKVPDAYTGLPYDATRGFCTRHGASLEQLHHDVVEGIHDWVAHELGEGLQFDDARVADPHLRG